jgi:hypothetical protein
MPKAHSAASELAPLLDGSSAGELIPELVRHSHGLQQLIELEVAAVLSADRHERSEERSGYRNGSRPRLLTTQVGDIPLSLPKLRSGSFFPTILESRRRIDQALYAVIIEAWVKGVSIRKVDALVAAIGSERRCRSAAALSSSPWASMPTAAASCWASRWVTAKASPSGGSSWPASNSAASLACSWSVTPMWA